MAHASPSSTRISAGVAKRYLRKGRKVYLEGQLQTRKWQDQSGADRYSTEIVLQNSAANSSCSTPAKAAAVAADRAAMTMAPAAAASAVRAMAAAAAKPQSRPQPAAFDTDLDDDVPF